MILEISKNIYLEEDLKKNCRDYPNTDFESFNACDEFYIQQIFNAYFPPGFMPVWFTNNLSIVSTHVKTEAFKDSPVDLEDLVAGDEDSDCPVPCKSTTIIGRPINTQILNKPFSMIDFTIASGVTVSRTVFTKSSIAELFSSFGGSLGLWLGLGIIQLAELAFQIITKCQTYFHPIKK